MQGLSFSELFNQEETDQLVSESQLTSRVSEQCKDQLVENVSDKFLLASKNLKVETERIKQWQVTVETKMTQKEKELEKASTNLDQQKQALNKAERRNELLTRKLEQENSLRHDMNSRLLRTKEMVNNMKDRGNVMLEKCDQLEKDHHLVKNVEKQRIKDLDELSNKFKLVSLTVEALTTKAEDAKRNHSEYYNSSKDTIARLTNEVDQLRADNERLTKIAESAEERVDACETQVNDYREMNEKACANVEQLRSNIKTLMETNASQKSTLDGVTEEKQALLNQIAALATEITDLKDVIAAKDENLKTREAQFELQMEKITKNLKESEREAQETKTKLETLFEEIVNLKAVCDQTLNEKNASDIEKTALVKVLEELKQSHSKSIEDLEEANALLTSERDESHELLESLNRDKTTDEEKLLHLEEEMKNAVAEGIEWKGKFLVAESAVERALAAVKTAEEHSSELERALGEAKELKEQIESQSKILIDEFEAVERERVKAEEERDGLSHQLMLAKNEKDRLIEAQEVRVFGLESRLEGLLGLEEIVRELKGNIEQKEIEIEDLKMAAVRPPVIEIGIGENNVHYSSMASSPRNLTQVIRSPSTIPRSTITTPKPKQTPIPNRDNVKMTPNRPIGSVSSKPWMGSQVKFNVETSSDEGMALGTQESEPGTQAPLMIVTERGKDSTPSAVGKGPPPGATANLGSTRSWINDNGDRESLVSTDTFLADVDDRGLITVQKMKKHVPRSQLPPKYSGLMKNPIPSPEAKPSKRRKFNITGDKGPKGTRKGKKFSAQHPDLNEEDMIFPQSQSSASSIGTDIGLGNVGKKNTAAIMKKVERMKAERKAQPLTTPSPGLALGKSPKVTGNKGLPFIGTPVLRKLTTGAGLFDMDVDSSLPPPTWTPKTPLRPSSGERGATRAKERQGFASARRKLLTNKEADNFLVGDEDL